MMLLSGSDTNRVSQSTELNAEHQGAVAVNVTILVEQSFDLH